MTTATTTHRTESPGVPLAIWPVAPIEDRRARSDQAAAVSAPILPELARAIVGEFSAAESLVLDPLMSDSTTVVAAAALGRRVIGVAGEEQATLTLRQRLAIELSPEARARAAIRIGDPAEFGDLLADVAGAVDLICTAPPIWIGAEEMTAIYAACRSLLREGGVLVTVTENLRRSGRTFDLAGATVACAKAAGLTYLQHVVSPQALIREGELVVRSSARQLTEIRRARDLGEPAHLVIHEDLCVFANPTTKEIHLEH